MPLFRRKLTWSVALFALPVAAQLQGEHAEASWSPALWPYSVPVVSERSPAPQVPGGSVSMELLRYPLSGKATHMLQQALEKSRKGDHSGAIQQLQKTLAKCPGSGAYVYSLLGVEYLKMDQIPQAVETLEQAVKLLPHDASNHANLGLAVVLSGQYDRAERELRRALELDPHNSLAAQLVKALAVGKSAPNR